MWTFSGRFAGCYVIRTVVGTFPPRPWGASLNYLRLSGPDVLDHYYKVSFTLEFFEGQPKSLFRVSASGLPFTKEDTHMDAFPFGDELALGPPPARYHVTFYVCTSTSIYEKGRRTDEFKKMQEAEVPIILTLTNGTEWRLYVPPEAGEAVPLCNGWLPEFAELLDGADTVCTFNQAFQYGPLRKYFPSEQRLMYWQLCTFDLYKLIKTRAKQWISLRDLLLENSLRGEHWPDATAATAFMQNGKWTEAIYELRKQVAAVEALVSRVLGDIPEHRVWFTKSAWEEKEPGVKAMVTHREVLSLASECTVAFGHLQSTS